MYKRQIHFQEISPRSITRTYPSRKLDRQMLCTKVKARKRFPISRCVEEHGRM